MRKSLRKNKDSGFFGRMNSLLCAALGEPPVPERLMILDELVFTILSQNTNDRNRDRAWKNLIDSYPPEKTDIADSSSGNLYKTVDKSRFHKVNWREVHQEKASIEPVISCAGLAPAKAAAIMRVLDITSSCFGKYSLEALASLQSSEIMDFLTAIKGVGPKTANCVICFSIGKPAFPVDTHVLRIMKRTGVLSESDTMDTANLNLSAVIPPYLHTILHLNIIRVGKTICRPSSPACEKCPLNTLPCAYFSKHHKNNAKKKSL